MHIHATRYTVHQVLGLVSIFAGDRTENKFTAQIDIMFYKSKHCLCSSFLKSDNIRRRAIWEKNRKLIEDNNNNFNIGMSEYTMAMNKYGDLVSVCFIDESCHVIHFLLLRFFLMLKHFKKKIIIIIQYKNLMIT